MGAVGVVFGSLLIVGENVLGMKLLSPPIFIIRLSAMVEEEEGWLFRARDRAAKVAT